MATLIKNPLSLLVLPGTPDTLLLQDLSVYRDFADYPRLTLLKPGARKPLDLLFEPNTVNVYRAVTVRGLPDGVYEVNYSVVPHAEAFVCYSFLRSENLQCNLNIWLKTVDWITEPVDSLNYQRLAKISALLMAAQAAADADADQATVYYNLAKNLLDDHKYIKMSAGYRY